MQKIKKILNEKAPGFTAKTGIILGSGLSSIADEIKNKIEIPYTQLMDLPAVSVAGHAGKFVLGDLHGHPVVCMNGRLHKYEGLPNEAIRAVIRVFKLLSCQELLITNASGSLRPEVGPGELMLIKDHINLSFSNPLIGPNDDEFGQRFIPMDDAYDATMRQDLLKLAGELKINLTEGVYVGVSGPVFETAAEIRAFKILGADAVGMSTVPDVIVARHCGLKVATIATITNFATGLSDEKLSHEMTLKVGQSAATKLKTLLLAYFKQLQ